MCVCVREREREGERNNTMFIFDFLTSDFYSIFLFEYFSDCQYVRGSRGKAERSHGRSGGLEVGGQGRTHRSVSVQVPVCVSL